MKSKLMKYYMIMIITIIIDQCTKIIVRGNMHIGQSIPVIGEFFQIRYIENTGAAFSSFEGYRVLLIVVPLIIICFGIWYLHKTIMKEHFTMPLAISLIVGGGIGNIIDRIIFASVTDMLSFSIFPPIFNMADTFVCIGCGILIINVLFFDGEKNAKRK